MNPIIPLFITLSLIGCTATNPGWLKSRQEATPKQKAWLNEMRNTPTVFTLPKSQNEILSTFSQRFIQKYSTVKTYRVTDSAIANIKAYKMKDRAIATFNVSSEPLKGFAYDIRRLFVGDSIQVSIHCVEEGKATEYSSDNEHIAAHYILTGDEPKYPQFIAQ